MLGFTKSAHKSENEVAVGREVIRDGIDEMKNGRGSASWNECIFCESVYV